MASKLSRVVLAIARSSLGGHRFPNNLSLLLCRNGWAHTATRQNGAKRSYAAAAAAVATKSLAADAPAAADKSAEKPVKKAKKPAKRAKKTASKKRTVVKKKKVVKKKAVKKITKKDISQVYKELLINALDAPKVRPVSAYSIYVSQIYKKSDVPATEQIKLAAVSFKSLSPSERERYNQIAINNKTENIREHTAWIQSHAPEQIRLANQARQRIRKLQKAKTPGFLRYKTNRFRNLKDDRQVKRPGNAFTKFLQARVKAGAYSGTRASEAFKLASTEFKELSPSEKKKYQDLYELDKERYKQEYLSVYGHEA